MVRLLDQLLSKLVLSLASFQKYCSLIIALCLYSSYLVIGVIFHIKVMKDLACLVMVDVATGMLQDQAVYHSIILISSSLYKL